MLGTTYDNKFDHDLSIKNSLLDTADDNQHHTDRNFAFLDTSNYSRHRDNYTPNKEIHHSTYRFVKQNHQDYNYYGITRYTHSQNRNSIDYFDIIYNSYVILVDSEVISYVSYGKFPRYTTCRIHLQHTKWLDFTWFNIYLQTNPRTYSNSFTKHDDVVFSTDYNTLYRIPNDRHVVLIDQIAWPNHDLIPMDKCKDFVDFVFNTIRNYPGVD